MKKALTRRKDFLKRANAIEHQVLFDNDVYNRNHDGKTEISETNSQQWYLDTTSNGVWDNGFHYAYSFGAPVWTPVAGKWS